MAAWTTMVQTPADSEVQGQGLTRVASGDATQTELTPASSGVTLDPGEQAVQQAGVEARGETWDPNNSQLCWEEGARSWALNENNAWVARMREIDSLTAVAVWSVSTPSNAICERVIGTLRRECMNYFIFVSEQHLRKTLAEYRVYYNEARPHQGIEGIPGELDEPRAPPEGGETRLVGKAVLGGLHHDYRLAA